MQRYEFNDGSSHKFWQIDPQGNDLHVAWGRIGTQGQTQIKRFDTPAQAQIAMAKLVKEKTGKGYVQVSETAAAEVAGATQAGAADEGVVAQAPPARAAKAVSAVHAAVPVPADGDEPALLKPAAPTQPAVRRR